MGLLDGLSAGLTAATKGAAGAQQGQIAGSQLLRALQMQQYQIQKEQADTALAKSHAHYFDREAGSPRLGDGDVYNNAIAGAAGAKISGETPALVDQTNQLAGPKAQAKATEIATTAAPAANAAALKVNTTAQPEAHAAALKVGAETPGLVQRAGETAQAEVPAKIAVQNSGIKVGNQGAAAFQKANSKLTDVVPAYLNAKQAFGQARQGNPAALKSAILSFASVADPKANLRQGVINMISQVDPSVRGNFDLAMSRLGSGTLPPRVLDDMEKMVEGIYQSHRAMYDQRRSAVVARQPVLDTYIPGAAETFDVPGAAPSAATGSAGKGTYTYGGKTYRVP